MVVAVVVVMARTLPSCYHTLFRRPAPSNYLPREIAFNFRNYTRHVRYACASRPQILPSSAAAFGGEDALSSRRIFVLSDLHTDYPENMAWVKRLSTYMHKKDVLLVAGDVAEMYHNFISTLSLLKDRFEHVFYVPGNHDLWCRWEGDHFLDSLEKLDKLLDVCREIGVETRPMVIDGLGIVPLFSWYHKSFDREKDITGLKIPSLEMIFLAMPLQFRRDQTITSWKNQKRRLFACKDFHACKWPGKLSNRDTSLAMYFDAMNEKHEDKIKPSLGPRQELCPEKRMLFYPNLPKIIGSDFLEARLRSIHGTDGSASACHVFGHTHFCWDAMLDGIRYVQAPLGYPRERRRKMNGGEAWLPFCILSNGNFADRLSPCHWSDYYAANPRAPYNTELAPWVARFYNQ